MLLRRKYAPFVSVTLVACLLIFTSIVLFMDTDTKVIFDRKVFVTTVSTTTAATTATTTTTRTTGSTTTRFPELPPVNTSIWGNYSKQLTVNSGACGGMANMMFRLAFLFGVGKKFKRKAYLFDQCAIDYKLELVSYFPNLHGLEFRLEDRNFTQVGFGDKDWTADDFEKLENATDLPNIMVTGQYLQSFKYFHKFKAGVRKIFQPSQSIRAFIKGYMDNAFPNSTSHKLCIHIRRGFEAHYMIVSEPHFTLKAAQTVADYLRESLNISVVDAIIFSDDRDFAKNAALAIMNRTDIRIAHPSVIMNRAEEMSMAHAYCDSMILTSAGSTFGWWMAYLMKEEAQRRVFYNGLMFKKSAKTVMDQQFTENDYIPPKWKRIQEFDHEVFFYNRKKPSILS